MTADGRSATDTVDRPRLRDEPLGLRAVILAGVALAGIFSGLALVNLHVGLRGWLTTLLLLVIAIGFEEGAHRAVQLQIRLRSQLRADMTSVWIVAAGLALEPGCAVILLVVIYAYQWFRQSRPAGELLHRKVYNAGSHVLAALAAGYFADLVSPPSARLPFDVASALAILVGVTAAVVVARLAITVALVALDVRGRTLLGSAHDNLIEIATPCLGGLVGFAVQYEPWLAILVVFPMITLQRGAVVQELETAAITDHKTGLLNAVAWEELARRELIRATRAAQPAAVLIIDIDRFKTVNDRFGHLIGDKVLAGVARAVRESMRDYDGLGRFGGEEFVAILPASDERSALVIAERVRLRVHQLQVTDFLTHVAEDQRGGKLSVSIGVAMFAADGDELPELLHAADQALYQAKWNGRNQVQLARRGDQLPDVVNL